MTDGKKDILIIMGRYLPGYKDGGPVRSIKNLVDYLGEEYNFKILTCDRDHGDEHPYPNIKVNNWNKVGKAQVFYVPPKGFKFGVIKKMASQVDLVYVCGCFSDYSINTLILNRFGRIKKPVVVAAMGLFSPKGFERKYKKKKLFTTIFNVLGFFKKTYWSATSESEKINIQKYIKTTSEQIFIAEDLPRVVNNFYDKKSKKINELKVVFLSRISFEKNLLGAIRILEQVKSKVNFTIYGPVHEQEYWEKCEHELKKFPENVSWFYEGNVDSENVVEILRRHHVFLFPTLGENYGHVIQEALSAGCPCIISDQTPWQDFEQKGVGYVLGVDEIEKYADAVDSYALMNEEEFNEISQKALEYAIENSNDKVKNTGYRFIFEGDFWK
ncbi:MAG: glycosyltransferase family 4 protein [Oscillospiraceae bacterium]